MTNGPVMALGSPAVADALLSDAHLAILIVLVPFAAIFAYATFIEMRRWYRHGPSQNNRAMFDFDESAPGHDSLRMVASDG